MKKQIPRFVVIFLVLLAAGLIGRGVYNRMAWKPVAETEPGASRNPAHGPVSPDGGSRVTTKLERIDPRVGKRLEAQKLCGDIIGFAKNLKNSDGSEDWLVGEQAFRVFEQRLRSLDARQLGIVLAELASNKDIQERIRIDIGFRIGKDILSECHPDLIMDLLAEERIPPGFAGTYIKHALNDSLSRLMDGDVQTAVDWFHAHSEKYEQLVDIDGPKTSLVATAGKKDLSCVPRLIADLGLKNPGWAMMEIAESLKSHDDRTEFLRLMRGIQGDATSFDDAWHRLGDGVFSGDFESSTRWITENHLSESELGLLLESRVFESANAAESARWIEWVAQHYPGRTGQVRKDQE